MALMIKGYTLKPTDLVLVYEGHTNSQNRKFLWPVLPSKGLAVVNNVILSGDTSKPALTVDKKGQARIHNANTLKLSDLSSVELAVSGVSLLVSERKLTSVALNGRKQVDVLTLVGVKDSGLVILAVLYDISHRQAGFVMKNLGCSEAMVLWEGWHPKEHYAGIGAREATPFPAKVLVVDPGHGGSDPGGASLGMTEKELNRLEALSLVNKLAKYDVLVVPTRSLYYDEEMDLKDRTDLANAVGADAVLSLHHNAYGGKGRGYEDFIYNNKGTYDDGWTPRRKDTTKDAEFQKIIHNKIVPILKEHHLLDRGMKQEDFRMVRMVNAPSVLVEWLFMDHPDEIRLIQDPVVRDKYTTALAEAVVEFLNLKVKESAKKKLYRVQVGAFTIKDNAENLVRRLKGLGFDAFIVEVEVDD